MASQVTQLTKRGGVDQRISRGGITLALHWGGEMPSSGQGLVTSTSLTTSPNLTTKA